MNRKNPTPFPFDMPDLYLEQSREEIIRKVHKGGDKNPFVSFYFRAASVAIVVAAGAAWIGFGSHQVQKCQTFTCLLKTTETEILETEMQLFLNEDAWGTSSTTWSDWLESDVFDDIQSL